MEIKDFKRITISNLILIILNDKNNDVLRKYAEIELKKEEEMLVGNMMIYYTLMIK